MVHGDTVPELKKKSEYPLWKKKVEVWKLSTETVKAKQALKLALKIKDEKISEALFRNVSAPDLNAEEGVKKLITELDKILLANHVERLFTAIENFETFTRSNSTSVNDYIDEFQSLRGLVEQARPRDEAGNPIDCLDSLLAFRLLKQARLPESELQMIRVSVKKLTFNEIEESLKRCYGDRKLTFTSSPVSLPVSVEPTCSRSSHFSGESLSSSSSSTSLSSAPISPDSIKTEPTFFQNCDGEEEPADSYFARHNHGNFYQQNYNRGNRRGNWRGKNTSSNKQVIRNDQRVNSLNPSTGQPSMCNVCKSIMHYFKDCPHKDQKPKMTMFESEILLEQDEDHTLMAESLNKALLDTGASTTVCGKSWLGVYEESLTEKEKSEIEEYPSDKMFRFGNGNIVKAEVKKMIPVSLCDRDYLLETHVVNCDIPLLLSRESMKKVKCKLDMEKDEIVIDGCAQELFISQSGHPLVAIGRCEEMCKSPEVIENTFFTVDGDPKKNAEHLHRYFAHASAQKIGDVVKNSNIKNRSEIVKELRNIENACKFCLKHKKEVPRKKVSLPKANNFNDIIALDLKMLDDKSWVLHIIDVLTRYSSVCSVKNKSAGEIVSKIFRFWISIFGKPNKIYSDNGGEFVNRDLHELCEQMDIKVETTPAEAPWCNGLVERHNAIVANMIEKVIKDVKCGREVAICWAVNAKNSLNNVYGFSSHQLVFGTNPFVPSILNSESLPALNESTSSQLVADHLNAITIARKTFCELENSDRIKRALKERVYPAEPVKYTSGDKVYFKRDRSWHGPATVIGSKGNLVIVENGGRTIRVHPCKLVLVDRAHEQLNKSGEKAIVDRNDKNIDKNLNSVQSTFVRKDVNNNVYSDSESESVLSSGEDDFVVDPVGDVTNMGNYVNQHSDNVENVQNQQTVNVDNVVNQNMDNLGNVTNHSQISETAEHQNAEKFKTQNPDSTEEWNDVCNENSRPKKIILKAGEVVRYRETEDEDWQRAVVVNRGGKTRGIDKNCFNVNTGDENMVGINCDKLSVQKLTPGEEVLFMEDDDRYLFAVNSKIIDTPQVIEAKNKELEKFKEFNVYEEIKDTGQSTISTRWVVTNKDDKVKARLVARGYEDMENNQSDSPTANKISLRIFVSLACAMGWQIQSLDIYAAFLQAEAIKRDVYVKPPSDIAKVGIIWQLKKPMYGLDDSARLWYFTLKKKLLDLNCKMSKLDKSVFMYYISNKLCGIIVTHVDDLLYGGNGKFKEEVIKPLLGHFKISRMASNVFSYLGWSIVQDKDTVKIDQCQYANGIKQIEVDSQRRKHPDENLTAEEVTQYQKLLGQLLWLSSQTRPDLAYDTLEHSTYTKSLQIKHLISINKVVRKLNNGPKYLFYRSIDLGKSELKIIVYSDASLGNLPNRKDSGRGYMVFLYNNEGIANVLSWSASKVKRRVHSVFGAETLGFTDAISAAIYIRQIISEILYGNPRSHIIPVIGMVDSKQLHDQIYSTTQCKDQRMRLDVAEIQESVQSGEIEKVLWVPTKEMYADCLTKKGVNPQNIIDIVESGTLNINI